MNLYKPNTPDAPQATANRHVKTVSTQGQNASRMGRAMEDIIEGMLERAGFVACDPKLKVAFNRGSKDFGDEDLGERWRIRGVRRFKNLYEVKAVNDFLIYDAATFPHGHIIEVKSQEMAGSVDEKYVFTVESLLALYDKYNGISASLLMAGEGARACAMEWIRSKQVWTPKQNHDRFRLLNESQMRRVLNDLRRP